MEAILGQRELKITALKATISFAAVTAVVARLIWPWLKLDAISVGLLGVAVVPWLSGLFESLEFPGGWKLVYRNLGNVRDKIPELPTTALAEGVGVPEPIAADVPSYLAVKDLDPELALVGLRIEVERRLQSLAADAGLSLGSGARTSSARLTHDLERAGVLPVEVAGALREVIQAGNAAAHGVSLPPHLRDFAFVEGPRILAFLDSLYRNPPEPR